MLLFDAALIEQHYKMADAIKDVKKTLVAKANGKIQSPERTVLDVEERSASSLYMPCANMESEIASIKIVSIFPDNPQIGLPTTQGIILLTSFSDGQHLAALNASYLTRLRTGAISAVATERYALPNASTLAVIGTGAMAFEQVLGVAEVRDLTEIYLYNRSIEKTANFKEKLEQEGITATIHICESADEATSQALIINCATRSQTAVIRKEAIQKGAHINGVGSYLPEMREIDIDLITKEHQVIVDDFSGVQHEAGEFMAAVAEGKWSWDDVYATLEDTVVNPFLTRQSDITLFKCVGAAYYDLAVAEGVYNKLKSKAQNISLT
ncbi:ornithine cyclodeaminase family protein [Kurthia zopfii]|uniref:ornithine cyclodeaminase family protein n=1 Tax=Kurthia zopfii TaxID=1650 RepID=UPI000F6B458E|nr:ornithine cyclodeaminase family protein [Kurthia zopfii]VEI08697.1 ornithine cyclodeaminase [Kurthia zopfii]